MRKLHFSVAIISQWHCSAQCATVTLTAGTYYNNKMSHLHHESFYLDIY